MEGNYGKSIHVWVWLTIIDNDNDGYMKGNFTMGLIVGFLYG